MSINQKLNQLNQLFADKNYREAMLLCEEILKEEPTNIYAKKYKDLIKPYLNDKSEVGKIATVKGKNLKCPHCESSISLSALNTEQKEKIRKNDYQNLAIKCPYCNTTFTLQKKSSSSIIGIQIGDKIEYLGKKYRVTGCVNYTGTWYEKNYSGHLNYQEWILLGDDNSYLYFSEGYFLDDGEENYEFEFSKKITPNFDLEFVSDEEFRINSSLRDFDERNFVNASSLYGENSKVFQVGESIKLYEFSYSGKQYVLEKEQSGRQSEAGIYETWSVSKSQAFKIFGKEMKYDGNGFSSPFSYLLKFKLFHLLVSGPIFCVFVVVFSNNIFEGKQLIELKDISEGRKYEIQFTDKSLKKTELTKTKTYDYGGVRKYYKTIEGLKFSVKTEQDKEIIEKLKKGNFENSELKKIFSEKIIKLK
ncbi:hypothetical protein BLD25_03670 [Candidatus Gracilibacteria bacterium GN02-872]|nr:hypothetical protein BLD25_03670 [Candidatus Gracilibacteria bacterium GN02-872]